MLSCFLCSEALQQQRKVHPTHPTPSQPSPLECVPQEVRGHAAKKPAPDYFL